MPSQNTSRSYRHFKVILVSDLEEYRIQFCVVATIIPYSGKILTALSVGLRESLMELAAEAWFILVPYSAK